MSALRWLTAIAPLLLACRATGEFICELDEQCRRREVTGACLEGSCAFPDPSCPSGARYDDTAAEAVAGMCVETVPSPDGPVLGPMMIEPRESREPREPPDPSPGLDR